jgi:hypothetical protein
MPEGLTVSGPFDIAYTEVVDDLPVFTANGDAIFDDAKDYASDAIAEIHSCTDRIADIAMTEFDVPIPDNVSQGVDFDMSRQALAEVMGRAPVAPTVNDIPVDLPPEPAFEVPTVPEVATFAADILEAVFDKLLSDILNGSYGIDPADEQALWERARDREMTGLRDAVDASKEELTACGFSMPPGALKKSMDKARKIAYDNLGELNREITIKRADLYRDARKFAIEQILKLQEVLLANIQAKLEAVKAIVAIYTAQCEAWKSRLEILKIEKTIEVEVYKGQVQGYEAEIKGIVATFELGQKAREDEYRAILNAMTANSEVSRLTLSELVEQAKLRMQGATATADVYKNIAASAIGQTHLSVGLSQSSAYNRSFTKSQTASVSADIKNNYSESKQLTDEYKKNDSYNYTS